MASLHRVIKFSARRCPTGSGTVGGGLLPRLPIRLEPLHAEQAPIKGTLHLYSPFGDSRASLYEFLCQLISPVVESPNLLLIGEQGIAAALASGHLQALLC